MAAGFRIILAAFFFFIFTMPDIAWAESLSRLPERPNYDLITALILWPAIFLGGCELVRLSWPFINKHRRPIVNWVLTVPYLLFVLYCLFFPIPDKSLKFFIIAVSGFPLSLIVIYGAFRLLLPVHAKHPRNLAVVALTLPYLGASVHFLFKNPSLFLWLSIACFAAIFIAGNAYLRFFRLSAMHRRMAIAGIVISLSVIAAVTRPPCCPPLKMCGEMVIPAFYLVSHRPYCDGTCKKPVVLGDREEELEERAEKGDLGAQYELGLYYCENSYSKDDLGRAVDWWIKAADANHEKAQDKLMDYHVDKSIRSRPWFAKAVERQKKKKSVIFR